MVPWGWTSEGFQKHGFLDHNTDLLSQNFLGVSVKKFVLLKRWLLTLVEFKNDLVDPSHMAPRPVTWGTPVLMVP